MGEDFSTIEHDFLHMKDCFNNYKFAYKERLSKLDFFQNIGNEAVQESSDLIVPAKQQLVEVKNVYRHLDQEIKSLSGEIFEAETRLAASRQLLSQLEEQQKALEDSLGQLSTLEDQLAVNEKMNEELDRIEGDIRATYSELEEGKQAHFKNVLESKRAEEQALKETKRELAAKHKRLTIVNIETYVEDLYLWYTEMAAFMSRLFGKIRIEACDDGCEVHIRTQDAQLSFKIQRQKVTDAVLENCSDESASRRFLLLQNYGCTRNSPSFLVCNVLYAANQEAS